MEDQPPLRHHHPVRYVIVLAFAAVIALSTGIAGQDRAYQQQVSAGSAVPIVPEPILAPDAQAAVETDAPQAAQVPQATQAPVTTPDVVRGAYLTEWSAGNPATVQRIEQLIATTELNAVIIDIKDATGRISYLPDDPALVAIGSGTNKIKDLRALTDDLHSRGIYVIGRVQVFEDPFYATKHPEDAFLDTRTGGPWRDYKGIMWLRPNAQPVWDYVAAIARDAHAHGVDEINVDYVRFPSDGELKFLDKSTLKDGTMQTRVDTLASFFTYLGDTLHANGIILSADLFGLTMSSADDLGIGQKLEAVAPHVDYVCPMVYPSHFADGAYGIGQPAQHPYEIIHHSLSDGIAKLAAIGMGPEKLRPWLQDFNLGAVYTSDLVRAQITAAEELGVNSWMLWDPRNIYTASALQPSTP